MSNNPIQVNFDSIPINDEQFYQLCQDNRDLRFERHANGDIVIIPPTGGETGNRNIEIAYQLQSWSRQNKFGIAFDSSTGFKLPNGAERSPDASWIPLAKWNHLTVKQRQKFIPLCPDFVIELRWDSDSLLNLQKKMQEYLANGLVLGWLIDLPNNQVEVYQQDYQLEVISNPVSLFGDDILSGFTLELKDILK